MIYHFCTFFDHRYLTKGLALYQSLQQQCPQFQLWILCFDKPCYEVLTKLVLPEVRLITQEEFERGDEGLLTAKQTRNLAEYYFTCKPSLPWFILNRHPEVDLITYLDADLFFFSSPAPIYQAMLNHSIAIVGHRFSPELLPMQVFGAYNAGWVAFRRDPQGLAGLHWWRERCLEWCYDRVENGRFADQKYLEYLPTLFPGVMVLPQKGVNLARWNLKNYTIRQVENQFWVDEQLLIFYHFHGVAETAEETYAANLEAELFTGAVRALFIRYFQQLAAIKQRLIPLFPDVSIGQSARGQAIPAIQSEPVSPPTFSNIVGDRWQGNMAHQPPSQPPQAINVSLLLVQPAIMQLYQAYRVEEAIQMLEEPLKKQPDYASIHNDLGVLLFGNVQRRSEAVFHFEQAVLLNPNEIGFLKNLAHVYEVLGRWEDATRIFGKILERWPKDAETLRNFESLRR
jgi:tetratricopeptide (TPR) repeat protein